MMKKLRTIKRRMKISRMSAIKIIQSLKKGFKEFVEDC